MFFTTEDYKKIQEWLQHNSIKDTDLPDTGELTGTETLVIVQNGKNVRVSLSEFIDKLFLIGVPDFINTTDKYEAHSLEDTIKAIPVKSRKIGQIVTFITDEGEWKIYQFRGQRVNQWNTDSLWIEIS
jgi:hypothetical protein